MSAQAQNPFEVGATIGIGVSDWDSEGNARLDGGAGIILGASFFKDMGEMGRLRAGGYYVERKAELKGATAADFKVSSIDVPVTYLFNLADGFGVFAGPLFSLVVSDSCDGDDLVCENFDPENFRTSLSFGVSAQVHPNWIVEAFYNLGLSEMAEETDANSAGVQATFIY